MAASWWWNLFGFGGRAFSDTIDASVDRSNMRFLVPPDSRLYITQRTRKSLNDHAEWCWQTFGIVKEGVAGIARHTIGKGVSLQLDSEDSEWNEIAEQDFETYAMTPDRCDLAGRRDFYEAQTTAIEQRLIRGEFFSALTENDRWNNEPCFQIYDSEEIGSPLPIPDGKDGKFILDGIGIDKNSRVLEYWIRSLDYTYYPIERGRMIHWYKPHAVNQTRGITDFAQGVNPLVDIYELRLLATRNAKVQQFLALVLRDVKKRGRGAFGAIENAGKTDEGDPDPNSSQLEKIIGAVGGGIYYAGEKGGAELLTSNSPSPLVEPFITDLLLRDACAGWGIPVEFFWNPARLNGNTARFIAARADLFFQILGERLADRFCTPIAFRYLSNRVETNKLRPCKDPNWSLKIDWQLPARVTMDNGRDNAVLIELLSNGLITMREYCNQRGLNYKSVMRQWVREPLEFLKLAEEEKAPPEYLQRLRDNLPLWRAPKPGTIQAPGADPAGQVTAVDENGDPLKAAA
ncbi:MAG TPA: phage portal protein [Candidatus Udaeobacter sp.]